MFMSIFLLKNSVFRFLLGEERVVLLCERWTRFVWSRPRDSYSAEEDSVVVVVPETQKWYQT